MFPSKLILTENDLVGEAWLKHHLKTFVKPKFPLFPTISLLTKFLTKSYSKPSDDDCKGLILNWKAAKKRAKGRTIFLPGRDVWLFEVLARLEGTKTLFRPDMSSDVYYWAAKFDTQKELFKKCYGVDSGYSGTIVKALKCDDWAVVSLAGGLGKTNHQLVPDYDGHNHLCILMEDTAKYWTCGKLIKGKGHDSSLSIYDDKNTKINQRIAMLSSFSGAAKSTLKLAKYWLEHTSIR